jgi:hypothetical protein
MSDDVNIEKDPIFKLEFWQWFDSLAQKDKERFWSFPHDFACLYYYNKFYRHKPKENKCLNA